MAYSKKSKRSYDKGYDMGYTYGEMRGGSKESKRKSKKDSMSGPRGEAKSVHVYDGVSGIHYARNFNKRGLYTGGYRIISAYPTSPMKKISTREDVSSKGY